ncbi:MAG: TlpA family protein disulfide reductase [Actinobacteria bacterium]|nr:TlpA family protein disulfide reductase [Actinomycetota bacterium]
MSGKTRVKPARARAHETRRKAARRNQRIRALGTAAVVVLVAVIATALVFARGSPQPSRASGAVARSTAPRVSVDAGAIRIGKPFPAFSVTDVDGRVVTKDSLSGKPTIIWFTTSYCLPCQEGAKLVSRLDDQLGGNAFNVLVMFVDTTEGPAALRGWREKFARPDWIVALDQNDTFARAVSLRALDTKFLLNGRGVLEDVNDVQADPAYLSLLQQAVQGTG